MNRLLILIFLVLIGCSSGKKVYICGDHQCKNQKEIDDYFANNISIEVYVMESKKSEIKKRIPDHDILLAGFPCQPFSKAGVSKRKSLDMKPVIEIHLLKV